MKKYTLARFLEEFPNDDACLEYIKNLKYPNGIYCRICKKVKSFTKHMKRPVYQCSCGFQVSPMVGSVFQKSRTPLRYWFYAFFLMSNTRSGISAKQLQRELGVTYKTAWRMMHQIRMIMKYTDGKLTGIVEIDETYLGGRGKNTRVPIFDQPKQVIMGMVERKGKAFLKYVPDNHNITLLAEIKNQVEKNTTIYSDQFPAYMTLKRMGYTHDYVVHRKEYVKKGTNVHTQNIEGLWSQLKRGIYGVYRHVSKKHLQSYIDEYTWRYNKRKQRDIFQLLMKQVVENT